MNRQNTMDQFVNIELEILNTNTNTSDSNKKIIDNESVKKVYFLYCIESGLVETCISISVHTFIMAVFEIYFYFDYIIIIEQKLFMDKIEKYTIELGDYYAERINTKEHMLLKTIFQKKEIYDLLQVLYEDYKDSLKQQKKLLNSLLLQSYKMVIVITSILIVFFTIGIHYKKNIHWKKIFIDNFLMFVCLGIFEYIFFMNIVLKYSPVTDAEIKYKIVKNILEPFITNNTLPVITNNTLPII